MGIVLDHSASGLGPLLWFGIRPLDVPLYDHKLSHRRGLVKLVSYRLHTHIVNYLTGIS